MKRFILQIVTLASLALLLPYSLKAQSDDAALYKSLSESAARLTASEDSLNLLLNSARKLYSEADDAGKEEQGKIILDLESKIFSLHSSIDDVRAQMQRLEQQGISLPETPSATPAAPTAELADDRIFNSSGGEDRVILVENRYFADNLPADVYASLQVAQAFERSVDNYLQIIRHQYDKMISLDSQFYQAPSAEAALAIYNEYSRLDQINAQISDSIATKQQFIIDTKSYAYNLILDKEGKSVMIDNFSALLSDAMVEAEDVTDLSYSRATALYPIQKRLVLNMERDMAEALSIANALDSLTRTLRTFAPNQYLLPPIVGPSLAEGVTYADARQGTTSIYSSRNPIPEAVIPESGTVYRLLVGSYTQRQAINIFRNASPLSVERKSDKRYYYYVGDYPNFVSATAAVDSLRAMGFRQPRVVVWNNGEYMLEPTEEVGMRIAPASLVEEEPEVMVVEEQQQNNTSSQRNNTSTATVRHRIEIAGAGAALSNEVRDAIRSAAPGKEISRIVDGATGQTIFAVGTFPNREDAEKVAQAVTAADGKLSTKIVELNR